VQRAIHRRDEPDSESFLSPGGRRATRKIYFLAKKFCAVRKFLKRNRKKFSAALHILRKQQELFRGKTASNKQQASIRDALDRDHRKESSGI